MKKIGILFLLAVIVFVGYRLTVETPEIRNAEPSGENIIAFGDSLTCGTGAREGMDYPSQLSKMISAPVMNAGIPGDTTGRALIRLERDVLRHSPRIVLVALGGNDLKNGVPKDEAFRNLSVIVQAIQDRGALVVIGGIEAPFFGRGFGAEYKRLAKDSGSLLIPNVLEGIMGNPKLMSDPIHPNEAGYGVMAQNFYQAIKPFL